MAVFEFEVFGALASKNPMLEHMHGGGEEILWNNPANSNAKMGHRDV